MNESRQRTEDNVGGLIRAVFPSISDLRQANPPRPQVVLWRAPAATDIQSPPRLVDGRRIGLSPRQQCGSRARAAVPPRGRCGWVHKRNGTPQASPRGSAAAPCASGQIAAPVRREPLGFGWQPTEERWRAHTQSLRERRIGGLPNPCKDGGRAKLPELRAGSSNRSEEVYRASFPRIELCS